MMRCVSAIADLQESEVVESPKPIVQQVSSGSGRPIFNVVRREEWFLLLLLLLGVALCIGSGTGFNFSTVLTRYYYFFATKILMVLIVTRACFYLAAVWHPAPGILMRLKHWIFGERFSVQDIHKTDFEILRGMVILFVSLTVYSNVKVRIPLINPSVTGDDFYQAIDHMLFGQRLFPWLEGYVRDHEALRLFLDSAYVHDYFYMVLLVFLVYLRQDRFSIRWIFISVAIVYMIGILITVAYPSYGPCFKWAERYDWVRVTTNRVGNAQIGLNRFYHYVLESYAAGKPFAASGFAGIAAFPSLHVAHMAILSIIAWKVWRLYAPLVIVMTILTFVATMAFGWHYAVDGIAGLILAIAITWWLGVRMPVWDAMQTGRSPSTPAEAD